MSRLVVAISLFLLLGSTSPAHGADGADFDDSTFSAGENSAGVWVAAAPGGTSIRTAVGGANLGPGGGSRSPLRCYWLRRGGGGGLASYEPAGTLVPERWYLFWCGEVGAEGEPWEAAVVPYLRQYLPRTPGAPGAEITADSLVPLAVDLLPLAAPTIATSPPEELYVNVPTYLAVSNPNGDGATALAQPDGYPIWARARAEFDHVTWELDNGDPPIVCDTWGTLFDPDRPDLAPTCGYSARYAGEVTVTTTVTWSVFYSTSASPEAPWGTVSRSSTTPLRILELEAVGVPEQL